MNIEFIFIIVLYWACSTVVVDQMVAKDLGKYQRVAIWLLWPILLPLMGFMYLITVM